jgi:ABC-2 type transport system ATP-binding protein
MNQTYTDFNSPKLHTTATDVPVIRFDNVAKSYGKLQVLESLSLHVERGEVYGFLGRNGAGKSTAIRMMLGITSLSSGRIELFGHSVTRQLVSTRQRIGYVAQEQHFYPWMTPHQLAKFVRGLYPRWQQRHFEQLLEVFELPPKRKIGNFSGGMKAKLALCVAVATNPECLILDEPTAGMDPVARREFLDLVSYEARRSDTTVFFSTHVIDDIESIADRIAIIEAGRTVYQGGFSALSNHIAMYSIDEYSYSRGDLPGDFIHNGCWLLQRGRRKGRVEMVFEFARGAPTAPALAPGWRQDPMTLEDVFVAVVAKSSPDAPA